MGEQEYTIVSDDSGHDYVIPEMLVDDWYEWVDASEVEQDEVPKWAERIDGGRLVFRNWRIA